MKETSIKTQAIIGMIISLVSFSFMIASLVVMLTETPVDEGVSRSFALWVFGMIVAYLSLIFYLVDAVLSVIKIFYKIHPVFNTVLAIMLIGAIPMALFVGGGLGINIYIWNAYYLAIFVLEIVSIVKHVKLNSSEKSLSKDS